MYLKKWGNPTYKILPAEEKRRKVIFIVSRGRTGSTLIGSIFNEHSDVIYLFEPFRAIKDTVKTHTLKPEQALKDIMACKYNARSKVYLKKFQYHRSFSKALNNPPFCKSAYFNCSLVTPRLTNQLCNNTKLTIVIKELYDRLSFVYISFAQNLRPFDAYIIHLVRDVRANLLSLIKVGMLRKNLHENDSMTIKRSCLTTPKNIKYFMKHKELGSFKYAVLRYEDFGRNPLAVANRIHEFVHMNFNDALKKFVSNVTNTKNIIKRYRAFGTSPRNIGEVMNKWRKRK